MGSEAFKLEEVAKAVDTRLKTMMNLTAALRKKYAALDRLKTAQEKGKPVRLKFMLNIASNTYSDDLDVSEEFRVRIFEEIIAHMTENAEKEYAEIQRIGREI